MTANSTVFKRPPLNDESLLIPAILVNHAKDNPAHPLFRYAAESEGTLRSIPWADAVCAFHRVAQIARQHVADHAGKRPVVAILGSFDHITYFSLVAGMLRVGYPVFPISPRNSKPAILHLLQSVDCAHVFTSADSATQAMADELVSTIAAQGGDLKRIPTPTFEDLYKTSGILEFIPLPQPKLDDVAIVMHSSGKSELLTNRLSRSVAFPKVIKITHRSLKHGGHYGEVDLCGHVWSAHTMPTFHFCGVMQFVWAAFTGITLAVFPPVFPPVVPTPARIFDDAVATKASVLCCVPSFLERFKNVVFAGGPLQASAGDFLVRNRVNVAHLYGLTETGGLNLMMPANAPQEGWDWFHLSTHIDPVLVPVVDSPGVYRLIVKICATHTPAVFNTTVDGVSAFDTNDLLIQHPQNSKLWKVYGRQDDQIMHSNGEKTNPGPLEAIILKNPKIKHALMFGRGKFNAGIILFPTEPFSPADTERVLDFLEAIWPVVQEANQLAPSHSRIFKDMILVADPSKAVELTAKGTLRREPTLQIYQDEIRELYANVGKSSRTRITFPEKFDVPSSLRFARRVVTEVMLVAPGDDEDIFQHGCDSLQATWILNTILHALRASNLVEITTLPDDFVYSHPTIRLIAESLTAVASGHVSLLPDLSRRAATMEETETVLITGTTGALGSHTLAFLLTLPEISTVYALNRPGANVVERQQASFAKHGIDAEFVSSPKLRILESDLTKTGLRNLPR
ncbi:hypothetical protein B0H14DRAFT_3480930 [Mycena olivaceomarginata]|nr:hypothetical protein B0H14DRAFT_3480930 [Mycena olivaceomarginata]